MKKLIYYIALSVMCLLPVSCSLEEEISTEVEKENYLNDASEAQNVLLGIYLTNVRDAMYDIICPFTSQWELIFRK